MSVTSSLTPGTVENSCATPSMRTLVIAAPPSEDSRTRRSAATVVDFLGGDTGDLEISGHEFLTLLLLV